MADARARRRRILEGGNDRLAYITGERKEIQRPLSCSVSSANNPVSDSHQEITAVEVNVQRDKVEFQDNITVEDSNGSAPMDEKSDMQGQNTCTDNVSVKHVSDMKRNAQAQPLIKGFCDSLDLSQPARAVLAFTIALFVVVGRVLTACHQPIGSVLSKCIYPWPILLILITDATIALCLTNFVSPKFKQTSGEMVYNLPQSFELLSQFLETVDIAKKIFSALALDCSIYLVALICGLSVTQNTNLYLCELVNKTL